MKQFAEPLKLLKYRNNLNGKVGFVPTMGALHEGHISLIKQSIRENDYTIVSIFVNPTQFLVGEDLDSYPSKIEADLKICSTAGVDIVFLPQKNDIYQKDELNITAPTIKGFILEGYNRPHHFDGVLQVVLKLLNITKPTNAYFGKKDAQQLFLITKMASHLFLDTNIVACDIIRESDGLALSSRNVYLSSSQRIKALALSQALKKSAKLINKGIRKSNILKDKMRDILSECEIEYIEIVDREFNLIQTIELNNTIILVAAKVGTTRLIDNIWI